MSAKEEMTVESALRTHLGVEGINLIGAKMTVLFGSMPFHPFRSKSKSVRDLDALEDSIRRICVQSGSIEQSVRMDLLDYYCEDGRLPKDTESETLRYAMMYLIFEPEKFLPAIEAARDRLSDDDSFSFRSLKSLNVKAIQTVDISITLWDRFQNKPAPRSSLNPASPFANFLQDMLTAQGIDADPKSAHRTWTRTYGANM